MTVRDRIRSLRRVRAGDLIPNPKNWRRHPAGQRRAVQAALAHKRCNGQRVSGQIPFGFDLAKDGVHLVENADEPRVLRRILSLRRAGRRGVGRRGA